MYCTVYSCGGKPKQKRPADAMRMMRTPRGRVGSARRSKGAGWAPRSPRWRAAAKWVCEGGSACPAARAHFCRLLSAFGGPGCGTISKTTAAFRWLCLLSRRHGPLLVVFGALAAGQCVQPYAFQALLYRWSPTKCHNASSLCSVQQQTTHFTFT